MPPGPSLLIADDEKNIREGLRRFFALKGYEIHVADDAKSALDLIKEEDPDIILTDLRLPDHDGLWLLEATKQHLADPIVIVFTAYGTIETAVEAMKKGAYDFLVKPVHPDALESIISRALAGKKLRDENVELKRELIERQGPTDLISESPAMKELVTTVKKIAPTNATVLIQGESGSGKEVIAHLVHEWSPRKDMPFVTVHCAALTESLLLSELFGHEKGAFTGASERKIGRFEKAHGGTLFLDEIVEIKEDIQVKLLRVLQNGEFERVGGTKTLKVDVRLICATNRNLSEEVRKGRFREDLYYRINVICVDVPPLRERKDDILPLANYFIDHFARTNNKTISGMDTNAALMLTRYDWPGNVRELKNIAERMVVLANEKLLTVKSIPLDIRGNPSRSKIDSEPLDSPMQGPEHAKKSTLQIKDMEKDLIQSKLAETSGNKSKTAKELGISRRTLYRKLSEYGLTRENSN